MNLEDVIDPEYGLQQDEWSLTAPRFGDEGQLEVIGWSGKQGSAKYYILKCNKCSQDSELFGDGYFRIVKGNLTKGQIPCGCARSPWWTKNQYTILCSRKARELGYEFLGFDGTWKGTFTKIEMLCPKHGVWRSGIIHNLINIGSGCLHCSPRGRGGANTKPDDMMIQSFFASGAFHPDTKFWRSDRLRGHRRDFWFISCPECGEQGEAQSTQLQRGGRPCACSAQRQQECYINWIVDDYNNAVALKFGIANNTVKRVKQQDSKSIYEIRNYLTYTFPDVQSCKTAERECLQTLECGVISKEEMLDGYTETTSVLNLGRIKGIYEKYGGTLIEKEDD